MINDAPPLFGELSLIEVVGFLSLPVMWWDSLSRGFSAFPTFCTSIWAVFFLDSISKDSLV